jgi:hypothetical protein
VRAADAWLDVRPPQFRDDREALNGHAAERDAVPVREVTEIEQCMSREGCGWPELGPDHVRAHGQHRTQRYRTSMGNHLKWGPAGTVERDGA